MVQAVHRYDMARSDGLPMARAFLAPQLLDITGCDDTCYGGCHTDGPFIHTPLDLSLYYINMRMCHLLYTFGDNSVLQTTGGQGEALGNALMGGLIILAECNMETGEFGPASLRTEAAANGIPTTFESSCTCYDDSA